MAGFLDRWRKAVTSDSEGAEPDSRSVVDCAVKVVVELARKRRTDSTLFVPNQVDLELPQEAYEFFQSGGRGAVLAQEVSSKVSREVPRIARGRTVVGGDVTLVLVASPDSILRAVASFRDDPEPEPVPEPGRNRGSSSASPDNAEFDEEVTQRYEVQFDPLELFLRIEGRPDVAIPLDAGTRVGRSEDCEVRIPNRHEYRWTSRLALYVQVAEADVITLCVTNSNGAWLLSDGERTPVSADSSVRLRFRDVVELDEDGRVSVVAC